MSTFMHGLFALALATGCTKATATQEPPSNKPGLVVPAPTPAATITLTAVAFADDCGGTPPASAPVRIAAPAAPAVVAAPSESRALMPGDEPADHAYARRRCEQTSMQLSVTATRAVEVVVKSVEVSDDRGTAVGSLTARSPTRWSEAQTVYQPWDGKVGAGETALVSYVLSQPAFVSHHDERDRTYTVKVIASVGGVDQPLQTTVMVVGRPAPVPT